MKRNIAQPAKIYTRGNITCNKLRKIVRRVHKELQRLFLTDEYIWKNQRDAAMQINLYKKKQMKSFRFIQNNGI